MSMLPKKDPKPSHRRADEPLAHIGVPMMQMVQNIKVSSKWTFSPAKDPKSSHLRAAERLASIGVPMLQLAQNVRVSSK